MNPGVLDYPPKGIHVDTSGEYPVITIKTRLSAKSLFGILFSAIFGAFAWQTWKIDFKPMSYIMIFTVLICLSLLLKDLYDLSKTTKMTILSDDEITLGRPGKEPCHFTTNDCTLSQKELMLWQDKYNMRTAPVHRYMLYFGNSQGVVYPMKLTLAQHGWLMLVLKNTINPIPTPMESGIACGIE